MTRKLRLRIPRIDAALPESGPRRWLAILGLVVGGLVAASVPLFLALVIWGELTGQDEAPPEPPSAVRPLSDGAPGRP